MKFFTMPNSKNIIATLRIVTIAKSELTLLILYFLVMPTALDSDATTGAQRGALSNNFRDFLSLYK